MAETRRRNRRKRGKAARPDSVVFQFHISILSAGASMEIRRGGHAFRVPILSSNEYWWAHALSFSCADRRVASSRNASTLNDVYNVSMYVCYKFVTRYTLTDQIMKNQIFEIFLFLSKQFYFQKQAYRITLRPSNYYFLVLFKFSYSNWMILMISQKTYCCSAQCRAMSRQPRNCSPLFSDILPFRSWPRLPIKYDLAHS